MKLRYRDEVAEDLEEASQWYEERRPTLGRAFLRAVKERLAGVEETPLRFSPVAGDIRRAGVQRFPYGIFFYVDDETIVVLAVLHDKRDPRRLRERR